MIDVVDHVPRLKQEFRRLRFPRARFAPELLEELRREAATTVHEEGADLVAPQVAGTGKEGHRFENRLIYVEDGEGTREYLNSKPPNAGGIYGQW